ncbi:MAG TPA: 50S ribosomal protein L4 [Tepidisphaeraceae bacterium]|nr:50S ribosomal protein L4 [Tepidisphaeraceae bacterium]
MLDIPVFNQSGQQVDTLKVDPAKLGGEVRKELLKQALVMYHANQRQGTVQTKARGEVAGSTRKLFKQKGTGNARTGGIRNPIKVGGGHAKQKRPKDWRQAMPKKARRLATKSAILSKIQAGDLKLLTEVKLDAVKTKTVATMFKSLGIDRSVLLAIPEKHDTLQKSARNIDRTTLTTVEQLNVWDLLRNRTLLMTKADFEKVLA